MGLYVIIVIMGISLENLSFLNPRRPLPVLLYLALIAGTLAACGNAAPQPTLIPAASAPALQPALKPTITNSALPTPLPVPKGDRLVDKYGFSRVPPSGEVPDSVWKLFIREYAGMPQADIIRAATASIFKADQKGGVSASQAFVVETSNYVKVVTALHELRSIVKVAGQTDNNATVFIPEVGFTEVPVSAFQSIEVPGSVAQDGRPDGVAFYNFSRDFAAALQAAGTTPLEFASGGLAPGQSLGLVDIYSGITQSAEFALPAQRVPQAGIFSFKDGGVACSGNSGAAYLTRNPDGTLSNKVAAIHASHSGNTRDPLGLNRSCSNIAAAFMTNEYIFDLLRQ